MRDGKSDTHIDLEHGAVTLRIPVLIMTSLTLSFVVSWLTFTYMTFSQVQTNSIELAQASRTIKETTDYIRKDQEASAQMRSDLAKLQEVSRNHAESIRTLSNRQWEGKL